MDIRPDYANLTKGKKVERVAPEEVKPGDVIMVTSGEKIPLDGEVVRGNSLVDTSAITGEAVPREVSVGDEMTNAHGHEMTKNVKARYIQPPKPIELPSNGGTAAIKTALITTAGV